MSVISEITEAITSTVAAKCEQAGRKGFTKPQLNRWVYNAMMDAGYPLGIEFTVTNHMIATGALGDLYHWDTKDGARRGTIRHYRIRAAA